MLIAVFVLFIIVFACRLLKLKLLFRLQYDAGKKGVRLAVILLNIKMLDYEFVIETDEKDDLIIKQYNRKKLKEEYTLETLVEKIKRLAEDYKKSFDLVEKKLLDTLKEFLNKRVRIGELSLHIKLGLSDAFSTAMVLGAVCAAVNTLLGRLYNKKKPKKADIDIKPDFQKASFEADLSCMISIRVSSLSVIGAVVYSCT